MKDIQKALNYLNNHLLPQHQSASFGGNLNLGSPNNKAPSSRITTQNQSKDRANSTVNLTLENRRADKKPSSVNAHQKAHYKKHQLGLKTSPDPSNEKLKQQSLIGPKPKV